MARLRNRMVKADFWTDAELLRWPRDKRQTYRGLWAIAEDSGCLEDDPFGWKLLLFPSPLDADITVERLEHWVRHYFGDTAPGAATERFHAAIARLMTEWEQWSSGQIDGVADEEFEDDEGDDEDE